MVKVIFCIANCTKIVICVIQTRRRSCASMLSANVIMDRDVGTLLALFGWGRCLLLTTLSVLKNFSQLVTEMKHFGKPFFMNGFTHLVELD